jgi:predicted Fe-Mo cluster-binding NifX family protein
MFDSDYYGHKLITMKAIAQALFHRPPEQFNCAQAVLTAYQETTGDHSCPVADFKPLGGGRAPGGTCGALHAACRIAPESGPVLMSQFRERAGSTVCKELKKDHKLPCKEAVGIAAELLEANLAGGDADRVRIAVPVLDGHFSEHFGGARQFLFVDANRKTRRVFRQTLLDAPEHRPGVLPRWLAEQKADAVLAGAIGERALLMFADAGITVHLVGEDQADLSQLVVECLEGRMPPATTENTRCAGHHHEKGDHCH